MTQRAWSTGVWAVKIQIWRQYRSFKTFTFKSCYNVLFKLLRTVEGFSLWIQFDQFLSSPISPSSIPRFSVYQISHHLLFVLTYELADQQDSMAPGFYFLIPFCLILNKSRTIIIKWWEEEEGNWKLSINVKTQIRWWWHFRIIQAL